MSSKLFQLTIFRVYEYTTHVLQIGTSFLVRNDIEEHSQFQLEILLVHIYITLHGEEFNPITALGS